MSDLILHHYPMSPVSELIRVALGYKQLAWRSVIIPNIAPKPDLTALTGGYRKTPVLQIGADIYCDSARMVDAIEAHAPTPTVFPAPLGDISRIIAHWCNSVMFFKTAATALGPHADALPQAFWDDRKALFGMRKEAMLPMVPHQQAQWRAGFAWVDGALANQPYLSGSAPGYADFAAYMLLWFVARDPSSAALAGLYETHANLSSWGARIKALGHGTPTDMTSQDALAIAAAAEPREPAYLAAGQPFTLGQNVTVLTEDPGADPVTGTLHRLTDSEISVLREAPGIGCVAVHFPRMGYIIRPA